MKPHKLTRPADVKWGFVFGCDGLTNIEGASEYLLCSVRNIYRFIEREQIRAGKIGGGLRICKRSLREFVASCEK